MDSGGFQRGTSRKRRAVMSHTGHGVDSNIITYRSFRRGADQPVEDVCDSQSFVCCPLLPLLVGFCSFEFVLSNDSTYLDLSDVVILLIGLCDIITVNNLARLHRPYKFQKEREEQA
jgi:hypothetical protein